MPGTTIPRGNILNTILFTSTLTPSAVLANTTSEQTFTVIGVAAGDYINCSSGAAQTTGIVIGTVRVTSANTISIQFGNITGGTLTPVAGTYGFVWGRAEGPTMPTNVL